MQQNQQLADLALKIGKFFLGQAEPTGNNDGPFVLMIHDWLDGSMNGTGWMKGLPWCANFATWRIYVAASVLGIKPRIIKSAESSQLWKWAQLNGAVLHKPEPGCLALKRVAPGDTTGKTHDHTSGVEQVSADGTHFVGLDGNFGDKVSEPLHATADYDFIMVV